MAHLLFRAAWVCRFRMLDGEDFVMDLQRLIDAMNDASFGARSNYHMTLGKMIGLLSAASPDLPVSYADGKSPGRAGSYRGYYSDLSFSDSADAVTAVQFLFSCSQHLGKVFEGYKGGDYTMREDTPLSRSEYGSASGIAIMDAVETDGRILLVTKKVD